MKVQSRLSCTTLQLFLAETDEDCFDVFVSHALELILKILCCFIGSRVGGRIVVVVQAIDVTSM